MKNLNNLTEGELYKKTRRIEKNKIYAVKYYKSRIKNINKELNKLNEEYYRRRWHTQLK